MKITYNLLEWILKKILKIRDYVILFKCFVFTKNFYQSETLYLFRSTKNALLCNYENERGKLFDYYKKRSWSQKRLENIWL